MRVLHRIGWQEYTASIDTQSQFLSATGEGTISIDVEVDSGSIPAAVVK